MIKYKLIRVNEKDVSRLRNEVKQELIDEYPELDGINMTDSFLFKKLIEEYLN